ncbi:MAG TPA: DUF2141 domain-containing protein [Croceibacterium sp.]|nr:DUF2141 domain-containing protein [Croceibacterium sp.]
MIDRARRAWRLSAAALLLPTLGNAAPVELQLTFDNMRDARGLLQVCLTRQASHFPDCSTDPAAVKRSVAASARSLRLTLPQEGRYALSVLHDANANGRADTMLGIPREGFGFSRNPPIRFGPPRFESTLIELGPGVTQETVRMKYIL